MGDRLELTRLRRPPDLRDLRDTRLRDAAAAEVLDHERPVLTHELADFANPYMMKRSFASGCPLTVGRMIVKQ